MVIPRRLSLAVVCGLWAAGSAWGATNYDRGCYRAVIPPGTHLVEAEVTILGERTLRVDHFTYDGQAPAVYFYLGAEDSYQAFQNGIPIGPLLDRPYTDESLTLTLPEPQTLDGYTAISVWCVEFEVNFSSGSFEPPTYPRACQQVTFSTLFHGVEGTGTILDERSILVEDFSYDGTAPAVYFYLGAYDESAAFEAGVPIGPWLNQPFVADSITVELPAGQTLDGFGAMSVWCAAVNVNFGSGTFDRPGGDFDVDGDVDGDDFTLFQACQTGPMLGPPAAGCADADIDGDGDVDQSDFGLFQRCLSGPDIRADLDCAV